MTRQTKNKLKPLSMLVQDLAKNDIVQFFKTNTGSVPEKSCIGYYREFNSEFDRAHFSVNPQVAVSESATFWVGIGPTNLGRLEKARYEDYLESAEVAGYLVLQRDREPVFKNSGRTR